jgi:hypothetical protein
MTKRNPRFIRGIFQLLNIAGGLFMLYRVVIRPWHLKWGTRDDEAERMLPGDELTPDPRLNATHAITIHAPVDRVWPWLVQIGQGRGGFYSYEGIETALGAGIQNVDRILPEFQHLKEGDIIPLAQNGLGMPVAILEPMTALVLHGDTRAGELSIPDLGPEDFYNVVWGWHLQALDSQTTRLIERWRAEYTPSFKSWVYIQLFLEPGAFIMSRKMLLGIKERAERAAAMA